MHAWDLTSGNAVIQKNVRHGVGRQRRVLVRAGKARHVVVLDKRAERKDVGAARGRLVANLGQAFKGTTVEGRRQGVVLEVVGHALEQVQRLVPAHVLGHAAQDLADGEDAGRLGKLGQELVVDVLGRVNAETVDRVVGHEALDPAVELVRDGRRLGGEVGEGDAVGVQPAVLVVFGVLPLRHVAVGVKVLFVVERVELGVVDLGRDDIVKALHHVIDDDVNHEQHVALVELVDELLEVVGGAEAVVEGVVVDGPVAVVGVADSRVLLDVLDDGADLDGREAHVWSCWPRHCKDSEGGGGSYLGCSPACSSGRPRCRRKRDGPRTQPTSHPSAHSDRS